MIQDPIFIELVFPVKAACIKNTSVACCSPQIVVKGGGKRRAADL